jgi:hypothetical protein
MTSFAVVEWLSEPLVPVMFSVEVPVLAVRPTDTLIVEFPEPVTDVGMNVAVTFAGKPLTLNTTVPVNPFTAVIVTVYRVRLPRATVRVEGGAEIVKSVVVCPVITSITVAEWVSDPLTPVTISV